MMIIEKIRRKLNQGSNEMLFSIIMAFAIRVIGATLMLIFNILLARQLGSKGVGLFYLTLSVIAISSILARLGLDNALIKLISSNKSQGQWGKLSSIYSTSIRMSLIMSIILSLFIFISADWISQYIYVKPELATPLKWMCLAILPTSMMFLHASSLKGLKKTTKAMVVQSVGLPLIALIFLLLNILSSDLIGAILSYIIGLIATSILGVYFLKSSLPPLQEHQEKFPVRKLWLSCQPLLLVSLIKKGIMPWAPFLLLGLWVNNEEIGIFGVVTRITIMVSFMLTAINSVIAPRLAEQHNKGNISELGWTAKKSAIFLTILTAPIFMFLFSSQTWVLQLFGDEFSSGKKVLTILLAGQFFNVICGSVGAILMMTGNEKTYRNINVLSAILQLLLVITLAPILGVLGAAIAIAIATIAVNLTSVYFVYKKFGFITIPGIERLLWR